MTVAEIFGTPSEANLPLFLHILGAMALMGALLLAATALAPAGGDAGDGRSVRLGFRALLMAALPSYVVMRVSAQWVASEEGLEDSEAAWIGIGYITSELGLLLMIIATVCAGLSNRRGGRPGLTRAAFLISALLVVMYVVTIWAMTTKPE
jgi:phage shock protein PspC (stress-responsive transcriptional regulator)